MAQAGLNGRVRYRSADGSRSAVRPIRVLLVDDSLVARTVLARLLEARPEFEIAGAAPTADQGIVFLAGHQIDIVVLDVEMPGKDGLTALPEILAASHGARVLIVSSAAEAGASATVRALTLGAADTLLKPTAGNFAGEFSHKFIEALLRIGHARHLPEKLESKARDAAPRAIAPVPMISLRPTRSGKISCLAIGASTGGLHALSAFLRQLSPSFDAPILITQHLPPPFMPYFAAQLRDIAGRPASVAADGMALRPGEMFIAPGEGHIRLARKGSRIVIRIVGLLVCAVVGTFLVITTGGAMSWRITLAMATTEAAAGVLAGATAPGPPGRGRPFPSKSWAVPRRIPRHPAPCTRAAAVDSARAPLAG